MTEDAAFWHRLQFAFTIVYHYLFPQLTMGLVWILVAWKWIHLRTGHARYGDAARFWARILGIPFADALVTGSFAIAAVGAFYVLQKVHVQQGKLFLKWGTGVGLAASIVVAFPTGDAQAKIVAQLQPPALAAMEGRFQSGPMAEITL